MLKRLGQHVPMASLELRLHNVRNAFEDCAMPLLAL